VFDDLAADEREVLGGGRGGTLYDVFGDLREPRPVL
jgi:hypothetical protein